MGLGPQKLKMLVLKGTVLCLTLLKLFSKQRNFVTHRYVAKNGRQIWRNYGVCLQRRYCAGGSRCRGEVANSE